MFTRFRHTLEMIRFSHTLFALPFALVAAIMAWNANRHAEPPTPFRWQDLAGILLSMVTARSAAMAFNRVVDRKIDAANPRTSARHIPQGVLSVRYVGFFAAVCSLLFVASTLLFLPNRLPLYFALPVMVFLLGYSYAKRFTALAHFWLGAALMLAPVCTWIAIRGTLVATNPLDLLPAVVLGGAVLLWVAGFDIIYSCQDAVFDHRHGLASIPARIGIRAALQLAAACHAGAVVLLILLPFVYSYFGWIYSSGVAAVAVLLVYEHALVRPTDLSRVNVAFFNVNAVIGLGLLAVVGLELFIQ